MNIFFDHVDWNSSAGPHWFASKLAAAISKKGHEVTSDNPDVQLAFVEMTQQMDGVPLVQRLDGIWYNTKTNYKAMNEQIKRTYDVADGVVFQSKFDRDFIIHHFGEPNSYKIIHNGADMNSIEGIPTATGLDDYDTIWCCASAWIGGDGKPRHNKRLNENLRYFQEHSGENDILCVAGEVGELENPDPQKIIFLGNLAVPDLISLYKRADWLIHLASQDHCPNVVVDARASGCRIVCAYSGGTPEIAGEDAILVVDDCEYGFDAWDYNVPTTLDFSRNVPGIYEVDLSMDFVADRYLEFFKNIEIEMEVNVDELTKLANKHGTDKGINSNKGKNRGHNFSPFYHKHFNNIKEAVTKVFEIGVQDGNSLRMWKEYFLNSMICGMDLNCHRIYDEDGIFGFEGDQSNIDDLNSAIDSFGTDFDIIVDDGGHMMEQQQISFGVLFPHVKSGGFYVIEDLHTSNMKHFTQDDFLDSVLAIVKNLKNNKTVGNTSVYMNSSQREYIEKNVDWVEIYRIGDSITSMIKKL